MKIAVCDDNKNDIEILKNMLFEIQEKWDMDFEISVFASGRELCEDLRKNSYDIFLLDIVMEEFDGIETAKYIRTLTREAYIVFISSYDERMRELLRVGAIDFLDKPPSLSELEGVLRRIFDEITEQQEKYFLYKSQKTQNFVLLKDIVFIESMSYRARMHMRTSEFDINEGVGKIWSKIKSEDSFVMPNKSFIVNLKYAEVLSPKVISVLGGKEITIGRSFKEETLNRYLAYVRRRSVN